MHPSPYIKTAIFPPTKMDFPQNKKQRKKKQLYSLPTFSRVDFDPKFILESIWTLPCILPEKPHVYPHPHPFIQARSDTGLFMSAFSAPTTLLNDHPFPFLSLTDPV